MRGLRDASAMKPQNARTIAVVVIFAASLYLLRSLLAPICWAGLIAIATWPVHERLLRMTGRRTHAVNATLLTGTLVALILVPFGYVVYRSLHEIPAALHFWSTSRENGLLAPEWVGQLPFGGEWLVQQWDHTIGQPGALSDYVNDAVGDFNFKTGRTLVMLVGHGAMSLFFSLLVLFFLYFDGANLAAQIDNVLANRFGPSGVETKQMAVKAIRGTVNGLVLVGLGLAVVMSVAYAIAHVRHPFLWGLATGLLGIVPFGAMVALAGVALYLLAVQSTTAAIAILVFGAVAIFVTDHFVRPLLITGAAKLPLVLALMGIVAGLETFGVLGIFIGPTLLAVMLTVWRALAMPAPSAPAVP